MSNRGSGAAACSLDAGDPLPPADRLTNEELRSDLEAVYRNEAELLARQLTRSGARDALDLVHEAFARLLAMARPKRTSIARPRAYLAAVSRNLQNDHGRTCTVHKSWVEETAAGGTSHHDQIVYLETRDTLRRLEAAVMQLKPVTRDIFLARRVDGLSYAEISERTGLSPNAIEKHMAKAIAKLSRLMDRD